MFAFCTKRFHMSEAIAVKRIRAGRAATRFPCVFGMIARGELHLSGVQKTPTPLELAGRCSGGMKGDVFSLTPKVDAALPHGRSSFTTGYPTEGAERTTSTTSSSAAEATINTRPTWSTGRVSWQRDASPRPTYRGLGVMARGVG